MPDRLVANVRPMTQTADHSARLPNGSLDRAIQLLGMAREELERAQDRAGVHLEDALVEAESTGDTDRRRGAWFPGYRAV